MHQQATQSTYKIFGGVGSLKGTKLQKFTPKGIPSQTLYCQSKCMMFILRDSQPLALLL